ncbi:MAG: flippase-like domain-containing protein [Bryobacterales bacterium]|nr:flippase-like domain-containing protein [Bryobacterales bacterium]
METANTGSDERIPPKPGNPASNLTSRRWLLVVASVVFTGAALAWLAWKNDGFSLEQFGALLRTANPLVLLGALVAGFAAFVVRSLRWAVLVRPYTPSVNLLDLLGNTVIGFAAVLLLGRPAELLRPYLISRQLGAPFSSQVGAWLLERIYDLLVVLGVAAWALSTVPLESLPSGSALALALRAGGVLVLVAALAATALLLVFTFASGFAAGRLRDALAILPEARRATALRLLDAFVEALAVSRQPVVFARVVAYSLLHFTVVAFSTWLVFLCLPDSAHLGAADTLRFLALLGLASAVPLPGLVGGYLLVAALLLTEWLRLPLEAASAITLAFGAVQIGSTVPPAMVAALRSGLNWRKIKNMEREAQL